MGFDIECIIDIHTYPGEYFCPVCRTLVYPSEALQSQCTHLYCKPCLAHVANSTRACPYDGYLVTEADSKPLLESDKSLAENIGKVKVHCLYHRSGCTWEGQLSECSSHCSSCAFGNSPVICNRCGVQIIHRQVHDHAQNCPGVYQVQQATDAAQDAAGAVSSGAAVSVNENQTGGASGAQASQAQVSQSPSVPLVSGQDSSQQPNASSHASAGVPAAVPTQEQWYQQQYQQYYQQYAGYAAYQQVYQQYNPYQQSAVQQHQPHLLAQPQQQSYAQAPVQVPGQSQPQAQVPPQPQPQPQPHAQAQTQLQQLNQPQSQPGQPVAIQTHPQILPQGQPQATTYTQPMTLQNQIQPQFHPQKQSHPAMPSHGAPPLQSGLPHGFPTPSQQYNQSQPNLMQPQQQQHVQPLQYQQPQLNLQHSRPHSTIHQVQHQPQTQAQVQVQVQVQPQPHAQILPQPHLQNQTPSQPGQPASLNAPSHSLHSLHPVSGHQSYPQAQLPQHGQSGVLLQPPFHARPASGPLPPGQMQGQNLQQQALMVPTSSHGQMPSQHGPFVSQVPGMPPAQQQQFHSQGPQTSLPVPQRPVVNPNQQPPPHQHVQQQPLPSIGQSQLPQPTPFTNQQGVQPQLRPQGPPYLVQQTSHGYFQSQQNAMVAPNSQHQQHTTYIGRPMMPTQGAPVHPPPFAPSSGGYGQASQIRPGHPGSQQLPMTQNFGNNMVSDQQIAQYGTTSGQLQNPIEVVSEKVPAIKDPGDLSKSTAEKVGSALITDSVGVKAPTSEAGISNQKESTGGNTDDIKQEETFVKVGETEFQGGKDDAGEPVNERRLKEEATSYPLEPSPNGKSFEAPQKEDIRDTLAEELEAQKNEKGVFFNAAGESLRATSGIDKGHHNKPDSLEKNVHAVGNQTAANGRDSLSIGRHDQPFHSYGAFMNQQRPVGPGILQSVPPFGAPPGPPTQVRPEGLGLLPQPRSNLGEQFPTPLLKQPHDVSHGGFPGPGSMSSLWRAPGHLGTGHAPPLTNVNQRDGIMGRGPQYLSEGQFLLPNSGDPAGQRVNPFNKDQPNTFRIHGGQGDDSSSVRSHDERLRSLHEPINSFSKEWPLDQGPKAFDRVHAFNYDTDSRFGAGSGGPRRNFPPFNGSGSFGLNDPRERDIAVGDRDSFRGRTDPNGPGGGYLGHATHGFAPGSPHANRGRSGRDDFDGRDMRTIGYLGRTELDGPEGLRFGDHVTSGPTANHFRRLDFVRQDIQPGHFQRFDHLGRENSPNRLRFADGVGPFSGQARVDPHGPGNNHHSIHFGDSFIGSKAGLRFGEPGFRSSFSGEGLRDGHYADDMDPFDRSRKRQPFSTGWCRICEVDCETVERLDMHSQTREHQKMAMDLVKAIKQQNKKKQRLSNARAVREEANKTRKAGLEGRGGAKP